MTDSNNSIEISVIVPCFNEEGNVEEVVSDVQDLFVRNALAAEIILVDDGSVDGTAMEIDKLSKDFSNVIGIHHRRNMGITEAWHSGLKNSHGKYIVTIDADLQYKPEDILILYRHIKGSNYDLVQGWRKESKDKGLFRRFLSKSLSFTLNMLFFTRIKDIKSGFVMYKREVFFDVLKDRNRFRLFQHFFILAALSKGYKIKQIPITFYPRIRGESFIKNPILFSFRVLLDIPRAILDFGIIKRLRIRRRT